MSYDGREILIPVLAIGERSGPVRLAGFCSAAYGVARAAKKATGSGQTIYVGLPAGAKAAIDGDKVRITSVQLIEKNLSAEVPVVDGVDLEGFLNPMIRRFQALTLTPQEV